MVTIRMTRVGSKKRPFFRIVVVEGRTARDGSVTESLGLYDPRRKPEFFLLDPATGRAGLLDCGAGGTGPLLYDVAAAVVYAGGADAAAEFLDGYLAAAPMHPDELEAALPVMIRFRWAVQADWSARRPGDHRAEETLRRACEVLTAG